MTDICYFVKKYAKQHSCEFVLICERVGKMRMDKGGLLVYNSIENERTFSMFMFSTKEKCEKTRYLTDAFDVVRHKTNMR